MLGSREQSTPPSWWFEQLLNKARPKQCRLLECVARLQKAFDAKGISYWMIGGTLLGSVRHAGFIPHDDDVDFGIWDEDVEAASEALTKCGGKDWGQSFWEKHAFKQFAFYEGTADEVVIDLFHRPRDDDVLDDRFFFRAAEVEPLVLQPFAGLMLPAPERHSAYLDRLYPQWKSHACVVGHCDTFSIASFYKLDLAEYKAKVLELGYTEVTIDTK